MVTASMQKLQELLQGIESYLEDIKRKENLSPWALKERSRILNAVQDFRKENNGLFAEEKEPDLVEPDDDTKICREIKSDSDSPKLHLNGSVRTWSKLWEELYDDTCGPATTLSSQSSAPMEDDIYEDAALPETPSSAKSFTETSSKHEDEESDTKSIAAKDIESPQMSGQLQKKKNTDSKLTSKIFGGGFKNHYVVLKDGVLYFYKKESDKAQKETLQIEGYDIRSIPGLSKDKADKSIQLFCPAKATYEFLAPSKDECKKWMRAFDSVSGKNTVDSISISEGTDAIDDIDGELYDDADFSAKDDVRVKPVDLEEEMYEDTAAPQEPDWAKLPPPPDDFYEDTAPPPLRPSRPQPQRSSLHSTPKRLPSEPEETYDDTSIPPPHIQEEIYDDNAVPIDEDIYDDTEAPPQRPKVKLPPLPQTPVKVDVQKRPPPPLPIEDDIYDDTEAPPWLPQSNPPKPTQSRLPAPPPVNQDGEEYDDTTIVQRRPPRSPLPPAQSKRTPSFEEYPGIDDFDHIYLSKWDHSSMKDDELSMRRGDMIRVLEKLYRDWWVCRKGDKVGLVPQVFLMKAYDLYIE